ncbi:MULTISPECIES: hypothetical protein [Streptosporangium]|uniref:Protein RecA n=1 Tax=Streptosporangium brasiliense TaxID=47480 RepID=A0ABT9RMA8_9ACTN|nr:hypothetical protein [Streptosporangium brasiliense]MDP9870433.1 recombination protein RecA [Streptosporangium brasiliense]
MTLAPEAAALIAKINKEHGEGAIVAGTDMVLGARFTTGSLGLDVILGGGWPGNQWVEVIGKESQGKTAIVLKTIAANQRLNPAFVALWIAAEHYDADQAKALGVDNSRVIVVPTQDMEFAYETMLRFAESKSVDAIVLDSYPALIPSEEAEKTMEDAVVALGARLTGKFFRKAGAATKRAMNGEERPILGIIINQYRDQIGGFSPHGVPQTTPGGKAKNYFFYTRVEVKRDEFIDESRPGKGKTRVGQVIKVRTIKHKAGPPQQVATVDFFFRDAPVLGFSRGDYDTVKELLTYGLLYDLIVRRGAYYTVGERRWGPGKEKLLDDLREDAELQGQLRADILAAAARPDHENLKDTADA